MNPALVLVIFIGSAFLFGFLGILLDAILSLPWQSLIPLAVVMVYLLFYIAPMEEEKSC